MVNLKMNKDGSSFRDPSGFIFYRNEEVYRQINQLYKQDYDLLFSSGLYENLVSKGKLIPHLEVDISAPQPKSFYKIIKPKQIPFISYPYEWSFSQLRDAALLTLNIQKVALNFGMTLKDASAYNIQFIDGHPIFIDTLSFTRYFDGNPWVAYRQFCQHFIAPLALMSKKEIRTNEFLKLYIDGIPLYLASKFLPITTWLNFGLLSHIHIHALAQKNYKIKDVHLKKSSSSMSKNSLIALIENLEKTIKNLNWEPQGTDWLDYYGETNYSEDSFIRKKDIVKDFLSEILPKTILDLGANTGVFSRLGVEIQGCYVVSADIDPGAVEINYNETKREKIKNILPLVVDLTNPSPSIGWNNAERSSFTRRAKADVVMALALIHHLAISNNLPLGEISKSLAEMCEYLIIEFVPKEDSQVQKLLAARDDIFPEYTINGFISTFEKDFQLIKQIKICNSDRSILLMKSFHTK